MKRIRIIGLALVAVFVMSAVAASAASAAAPEFKPFTRCSEKEGTGEYKTKAECQSPTGKETKGGKFKRNQITFTDESGPGKLEVKAAGTVVECKTDKSKGVITGPKTVGKVSVTFGGCKAKNGTKECEVFSPGLKGKAEIETKELEGELGKVALGESATGVGLDLKPVPANKGIFVILEGECLPITPSPVEGSVIGEVTPIKTLATTGKLIYALNAAKEQKIQKFEKGVKDTLIAFTLEATEETTDTITYAEAVEVT